MGISALKYKIQNLIRTMRSGIDAKLGLKWVRTSVLAPMSSANCPAMSGVECPFCTLRNRSAASARACSANFARRIRSTRGEGRRGGGGSSKGPTSFNVIRRDCFGRPFCRAAPLLPLPVFIEFTVCDCPFRPVVGKVATQLVASWTMRSDPTACRATNIASKTGAEEQKNSSLHKPKSARAISLLAKMACSLETRVAGPTWQWVTRVSKNSNAAALHRIHKNVFWLDFPIRQLNNVSFF